MLHERENEKYALPMRRRSSLLLIVVLFAVVAAAASAASARPPARTAASRIRFYEDVGVLQGLRVRPPQIGFAADGNDTVTGLHWHGWGSSVSYAGGTNHVNNCNPSCAQGHISPVHVRVTLSQPGTYHGHYIYLCYAVKPAAAMYLRHSCLP